MGVIVDDFDSLAAVSTSVKLHLHPHNDPSLVGVCIPPALDPTFAACVSQFILKRARSDSSVASESGVAVDLNSRSDTVKRATKYRVLLSGPR